jgi:4-hydroxybenzoate polyprenyltransferase
MRLNSYKISGDRSKFPLVVDLDGTITPTDTLLESVIRMIKRSPLSLFTLPWLLLRGRAAFKDAVARQAGVSADLLPYREALISYLRDEKTTGRRIILATAAHQSIAESVSTHLGLFDDIIATDLNRNLKGTAKLQAIQERLGNEFVYAGDSRADIPIWRAASAAILVGVPNALAQSVGERVPIERNFSSEPVGIVDWLRAFRVHQWVKNLLLFVPLLTAFSFSGASILVTMVWVFLAFSLAASATYIANDLWDLESDRAHPRKRLRPFASGRISIKQGLLAGVFALLLGFAFAYLVSPAFLLMLLLYVVLTTAYSLVLKNYVLIDVLMLAVLYTMRILAGSVAFGITTSSWLLAFSLFTFLSLALVKRCSELVSLQQMGKEAADGRDYRVSDLAVLWPLGTGASLAAIVVFGLFVSAPETQARYSMPSMLWPVAMGLIFWLGRLWIKTARGEMHDDPIVYAIRDFGSRITLLAMVAAICVAQFFKPSALL